MHQLAHFILDSTPAAEATETNKCHAPLFLLPQYQHHPSPPRLSFLSFNERHIALSSNAISIGSIEVRNWFRPKFSHSCGVFASTALQLQTASSPASLLGYLFFYFFSFAQISFTGAIEAAAAAESKKGGRRGGPVAVVEKSGPALRNAEMELRKCCNHPYLVDGIEDQVRLPRQKSHSLQFSS